MRVIDVFRERLSIFALILLMANPAWGGETAPAPAPKMVMKTIRTDQVQSLAGGLETCLVSMKVTGQRSQVVVRLREAGNDAFLKWAELKEGDMVVSVNNSPALLRDDVVKAAKELKPGRVLQLDLTRQGKPIVLRIRIGDGVRETPVQPQSPARPAPQPEAKKSNDGAIVVDARQMERELKDLDPVTLILQAAPQMVEDANGTVLGITSDNLSGIPLAGKVGLQSGDVIQSVNGIPITSEASLFELADRLQGQTRFEARILRNGKPIMLRVVAE